MLVMCESQVDLLLKIFNSESGHSGMFHHIFYYLGDTQKFLNEKNFTVKTLLKIVSLYLSKKKYPQAFYSIFFLRNDISIFVSKIITFVINL